MTIVSLVAALLLAALLAPSAWGKLTREPRQVEGMRAVGYPPSKLWVLAWLEIAAIAGLLVGLWWPPAGILAALGLVGYFVGAVIYLLRARITRPLRSAIAFLVLSVAVCWLTSLTS